MPNLEDTATMTMDLYYQNFRQDEDFFRLHHFKYLCGVAYSKLLEDEYKEARALAKLEDGFADIYLQSDWLTEARIKIGPSKDLHNAYEGVMANPMFSFPYDPYSFSIQSIRPVGETRCRRFVRTTAREAYMDCHLPVTENTVFWYAQGKKIIVENSMCKLDEVLIFYVPEITDGSFGATGGPVAHSKEDTIIRKTLDMMMRAREGSVVDMSNNSNPNKTIQTEIDSAFAGLKTKPI